LLLSCLLGLGGLLLRCCLRLLSSLSGFALSSGLHFRGFTLGSLSRFTLGSGLRLRCFTLGSGLRFRCFTLGSGLCFRSFALGSLGGFALGLFRCASGLFRLLLGCCLCLSRLLLRGCLRLLRLALRNEFRTAVKAERHSIGGFSTTIRTNHLCTSFMIPTVLNGWSKALPFAVHNYVKLIKWSGDCQEFPVFSTWARAGGSAFT
jgi:hypothetical protein